MNIWGNSVRIELFGESRGKAVGCIVDGLPAGELLDLDAIRIMMDRRLSRMDGASTPRREGDAFEVVSGVYKGKTSGAPLCAIIRNLDADFSNSNSETVVRPSHADYAARVKYMGYNDPRGGGQLSGRLTAPLVFAGAVCKTMLLRSGIAVGAHVASISDVFDERFDPVNVSKGDIDALDPYFPLLNPSIRPDMEKALRFAADNNTSVGGIVECAAVGMPAGKGRPIFESVEGMLSQLLFSIPGVKGVDFGAGFDISSMFGHESNDQWRYDETGKPITTTNHAGGINGGITNGMPVIAQAAFRPVPTIGRPQNSIDVETMKNISIELRGRNDVCILPRGAVAVEAAMCICMLDMLEET